MIETFTATPNTPTIAMKALGLSGRARELKLGGLGHEPPSLVGSDCHSIEQVGRAASEYCDPVTTIEPDRGDNKEKLPGNMTPVEGIGSTPRYR